MDSAAKRLFFFLNQDENYRYQAKVFTSYDARTRPTVVEIAEKKLIAQIRLALCVYLWWEVMNKCGDSLTVGDVVP